MRCRYLPIIFLLSLLPAACLMKQAAPPPPTAAAPPCPPPDTSRLEAADQARRHCRQALNAAKRKMGRYADQLSQTEAQLNHAQLKLLEKEAQINDMQQRLQIQQKRLDDAITEVVRSKAKLRSLETKAEAASTIAEAEIAVKSFKRRLTENSLNRTDALVKAERLMRVSTREFKKQNYGGALYLAHQAKKQIQAGREQLLDGSDVAALTGEVTFARPLPLEVKKKSNFRSGPGLTFPILTELPIGTFITGHAYKGKWIRADAPSGMKGWIYQPLVGVR